jgi:hypothetical protein
MFSLSWLFFFGITGNGQKSGGEEKLLIIFWRSGTAHGGLKE